MNNERIKILVVDDVDINRIILTKILSDTYEVEQAADGTEAISILRNSDDKPHLVLLDIVMPGVDGFEVLQFMKAEPSLCKIPVIFISATDEERKGLSVGAVDYISKPFEPDIVQLRVANHIELAIYREKLESMVQQKVNELISTKELFLETMADLIEYRSLESGSHVKRTKELAGILVNQLSKTGRYKEELMDENKDQLINAMALHDIGKIGIPDSILLKPGKLTPEEFKTIETHTVIGGQVIESLMLGHKGNNHLKQGEQDEYFKHCYDICRSHHERWDGRGYPDGLSGTDIPLSARIAAAVDIYDALVSERCYKKAYTHEEALEILKDSAGNHLDPEIVNALVEVNEQFKNK